ncbi:MAG: hypothetical protein SVX28_12415, partial [Pseudomonadota bacterium]|nr:hypothetical protein [Pseudomonadota bacterium]
CVYPLRSGSRFKVALIRRVIGIGTAASVDVICIVEYLKVEQLTISVRNFYASQDSEFSHLYNAMNMQQLIFLACVLHFCWL